MEFRTILSNDSDKFISEPGKPTLDDYEYGYDKHGHKILKKKKDPIPVYEKIQACADSCDINLIMERFALGDTEALNINKGYYLDTTNLPKNIFEVYEKGLEAEQYFEGLPEDFKELFDNSSSVFYHEMVEPGFDKKVNDYNDKFVNHQFDEKTEGVNYNE